MPLFICIACLACHPLLRPSVAREALGRAAQQAHHALSCPLGLHGARWRHVLPRVRVPSCSRAKAPPRDNGLDGTDSGARHARAPTCGDGARGVGVLAADVSVVRDAALLGDADGAVPAPYALDALRVLLPLPDRATDVLDFSGKWCRERAPQRGALLYGSHVRRSRRDAAHG